MTNVLFPQAVIFDWDNTLVDSYPVIATAMNRTRKHFNLPVWSLAEVKNNCIRSAKDSFPEWFGTENWQQAYEIYYSQIDEVRKTQSIDKMPGAQELLDWLKTTQTPLFIVSNKRGDYLRQEIDALNWQGFFRAIAGAQDAEQDKPNRAPVDKVLRAAAMTPHKGIWFVGDSETDVKCAQNSDCTPVFIGSTEKAQSLGVDTALSDCHALQRLLYSLHNK